MKYYNIHLEVMEDLFTQLFALDQCYLFMRQHLVISFCFYTR